MKRIIVLVMALVMMLLLILYNVRSERELMNTLATIKKYSFSFCSRVLNIRNVVDRFLKDSLSTARGYQCFAKRMLWKSALGNRPMRFDPH